MTSNEPEAAEAPGPPILEIEQLKKSYRTPGGAERLIIDVPELSLKAGEQAALEGESGTGKTTLLHLIAGILDADAGQIRVAGEDVMAMSEARRDQWRALHMGYVFQTFNLLQGYSALENVTLAMSFGRGVDRARAVALLENVGLGERLDDRPSRLSVGQQQRVAVARALANKPDLVLADEPTGNLDQKRALESLSLIREACEKNGAALLLVSHDPAILECFERRMDLRKINRAPAEASL